MIWSFAYYIIEPYPCKRVESRPLCLACDAVFLSSIENGTVHDNVVWRNLIAAKEP